MPRGPQGQKRPADVIGAAIKVAKIATGEIIEDANSEKSESARKGGLKGGMARSEKLSKQRKSEIASSAAKARWKRAD